MNNRKLQVWLPILLAVVMIAGMFLGYKLRENTNTAGNFFKIDKKSPLQEVIDIINIKYVDAINTDTLGDGAIKEILQHLDPHSTYIPARDLRDVNADLLGNFEGIGVEFSIFNDTVNVVNVIKDGPSEKAGIQIGDKFIKVDGKIIAGKKISNDDVRNTLRGANNSKVAVTILRNGELIEIPIARGRIPLPALDAAYMIEPEIGFIRISKFSETTYEEFMHSMEKLQAKGMKKLILDLRSNGGGLMGEAVDMADEFLEGDKLIVYTEGNKVKKQEYRAKRPGLFESGELVLLMDENSASASEVLAGALQDWDRATIIGRRSFGKGLVQEQFQLNNGGAFRITVARYYTPMGRSIQKPYDMGVLKYNEELKNRYQNGSLLAEDTIPHAEDEKFFTTKKGKKLYGGGGINPDIFVPIDTLAYSKYLSDLYVNGTISNFVYNYYIENRPQLDTISSPLGLLDGVLNDARLLTQLKQFALRDAIQPATLSLSQEAELLKRIKNMLARQIWRNEGYFEVNNTTDPLVQKAVLTLKDSAGAN